MHATTWKQPIWQTTHSATLTTVHSGKGMTMERAKRSVVTRGPGERGMNRWRTEHFQGRESTLGDTNIIDACHIHLSKLTECVTPWGNPDENHDDDGGCASVSTLIVKSTPLGNTDCGGCCAWLRTVLHGKSLHFLINFAVSLKVLLCII